MSIKKNSFVFFCFFYLLAFTTFAQKKTTYDSLIIFGDSLSDVGSYKVGAIRDAGGGKFSVNFPSSLIWPEILAKEIGLSSLCPAITGFNNPTLGIIPTMHHINCQAYAQGGSRITNPQGIGNNADKEQLGALTIPVVDQIRLHLKNHHAFSKKDLVALWAGSNDILAHMTSQSSITDVLKAADELVLYIKDLILKNGAERVLVINIGNIKYTPLGAGLQPDFIANINETIMQFNKKLASGLKDEQERVLLLDIFSEAKVWAHNLGSYGISNITHTACDLRATLYPTALLCTKSTLTAQDTSSYFFADLVHPAPKGHEIIANFVINKLKMKGWLPIVLNDAD